MIQWIVSHVIILLYRGCCFLIDSTVLNEASMCTCLVPQLNNPNNFKLLFFTGGRNSIRNALCVWPHIFVFLIFVGEEGIVWGFQGGVFWAQMW